MGKLILVPTPLGNLEDITLRALRVLKEVDFIMAEDTRVSLKLLQHYGIQKPLQPFHAHNEHKAVEGIVERLVPGEVQAALISDAGTPGISDPGFLLVRECLKKGVDIECLPGPTAFVPALVCSGMPCDRFVFEGFLPHKKGRQTKLKALEEETRTIVLYESPYRLLKLLEEIHEFIGEERQVCVAREITKLFEEYKRGKASELLQYYKEKGVKGEIVVVVEGKG